MAGKRMLSAGTITLALLLACSASGQEKGRNAGGSAPAVTPTPEVFFCDTETPECRSVNSEFDMSKVRDVFVFVAWKNLSGEFVQTIEFYLPDGSLYMKKDTPFLVRKDQARARWVKGSNVPERYLTTSRGTPTVVTAFPVAGTYLKQRSLSGSWSVRVLLNDQPVAKVPFQLKAVAQEKPAAK